MEALIQLSSQELRIILRLLNYPRTQNDEDPKLKNKKIQWRKNLDSKIRLLQKWGTQHQIKQLKKKYAHLKDDPTGFTDGWVESSWIHDKVKFSIPKAWDIFVRRLGNEEGLVERWECPYLDNKRREKSFFLYRIKQDETTIIKLCYLAANISLVADKAKRKEYAYAIFQTTYYEDNGEGFNLLLEDFLRSILPNLQGKFTAIETGLAKISVQVSNPMFRSYLESRGDFRKAMLEINSVFDEKSISEPKRFAMMQYSWLIPDFVLAQKDNRKDRVNQLKDYLNILLQLVEVEDETKLDIERAKTMLSMERVKHDKIKEIK